MQFLSLFESFFCGLWIPYRTEYLSERMLVRHPPSKLILDQVDFSGRYAANLSQVSGSDHGGKLPLPENVHLKNGEEKVRSV
jgi:hypothetical protein